MLCSNCLSCDANSAAALDHEELMKEILTNLAVFTVLAIGFSALTACTGSSEALERNLNTTSNSLKKGGYPKLSSGLAEAQHELLDGTKFRISDHKGKVLILNIWGTWCGPCRAEIPHLVKMKEKYGDQGFEVLGLNIGDGAGQPESIEDIKRFAEQMKINYIIARTPGTATAQFYAITKQQVVPQTMLVDREGHVRGIFVGGGQRIIDSMNQNLDKVMNE